MLIHTCSNNPNHLLCLSWITGVLFEDIAEEDAETGEEDEMADFIVEEEEVYENETPMRYFIFFIVV